MAVQHLESNHPQSSRSVRFQVMSTPVDVLTMTETVSRIEAAIDQNVSLQHVVVNAAKIVELNKNPKLKEVIEACDIINIDGQAVVWAARLLGVPVQERVAGIDLMENLVALAHRRGWGVFLLGAKETVLEAVELCYQKKYPGLIIAGKQHGYFKPEDEDGIADLIAASGAKILFVAISSPKKEFFLSKYKERMKVPFVMGVGGSFDVVAGIVKRAPQWMQRLGLEWLFRFLQEPKRMWRRYIIGNAEFIILLVSAFLNKGKKMSTPS